MLIFFKDDVSEPGFFLYGKFVHWFFPLNLQIDFGCWFFRVENHKSHHFWGVGKCFHLQILWVFRSFLTKEKRMKNASLGSQFDLWLPTNHWRSIWCPKVDPDSCVFFFSEEFMGSNKPKKTSPQIESLWFRIGWKPKEKFGEWYVSLKKLSSLLSYLADFFFHHFNFNLPTFQLHLCPPSDHPLDLARHGGFPKLCTFQLGISWKCSGGIYVTWMFCQKWPGHAEGTCRFFL